MRREFGFGPYRENDSRRQGCRPIQRNFLIVCEGQQTEPNYFNAIRRRMKSGSGSRVEIVGAGTHTRELLKCAQQAIDRRLAEGLPTYYHVWLVFDRDSFEADDFDNAIKMAEESGWHAGWSNEAFELWYLLHFQEVTGGAIPREQMFKMLGHHCGRPYHKSASDFFAVIAERSYVAIERAKRLAGRWRGTPPHEACPCTMVWPLIEELLKYT